MHREIEVELRIEREVAVDDLDLARRPHRDPLARERQLRQREMHAARPDARRGHRHRPARSIAATDRATNVHLVKDILERSRLRLRDHVVALDTDRTDTTQETARTTGDEDVARNSGSELRKPRARAPQVGIVELEIDTRLGIEHPHVRLDQRRDVLTRRRARIAGGLRRARAETRRRKHQDPRQTGAHRSGLCDRCAITPHPETQANPPTIDGYAASTWGPGAPPETPRDPRATSSS